MPVYQLLPVLCSSSGCVECVTVEKIVYSVMEMRNVGKHLPTYSVILKSLIKVVPAVPNNSAKAIFKFQLFLT